MCEKKTTVRDLAKETGVSIATISRYLNQDYGAMSEATRLRIQKAVEKSGYINTKSRNRGTVAVVLPGLADPFFAQMIEQFSAALEGMDYALQLYVSRNSMKQEEQIIRSLINSSVSGIIYMSTVTSEENCIDLLLDSGKPFVVMDSYLSEYNAPALVFSDGSYGMYETVKYLLAAGHEKIAYLSGLKIGVFEHYRYQGYVNALLDAELAVNPELIRFIGFGLEDGMRGISDLLDSGVQFTAVVCESDQLAAGVYKVCRRRGIDIPKDLSVVGVNNSFIADMLEPGLTSLDQRIDIQVENAIALLQKRIRGEVDGARVCKVASELVCRDSVCKRKL